MALKYFPRPCRNRNRQLDLRNLNGREYMIDLLREKIVDWLRSRQSEITLLNPVHVHLDDLMNYNAAVASDLVPHLPSMMLQVAVESKIDLSVSRLMCIVPLNYSDELDASLPCFPVPSEELGFEPISIYLARRLDLLYYESVEEYKRPLLDMYLSLNDVSVVAYYRVFRSAEGVRKKWEYSRCLYFEVLENRLLIV